MKLQVKIVRYFTLAALLSLTASSFAQTDKPASGSETKSKSYSTSLLSSLAGIPAWAGKLQASLEKQGDAIELAKEKRKMLPVVTTIQSSLSSLEDVNKDLTEKLSSSPPDRHGAVYDLNQISQRIRDLRNQFSTLRQNAQRLSSPPLTNMERSAEELMGGKADTVDRTLEQLGYRESPRLDVKPKPIDLQARSKELIDLLHQAQDAFGKLHQYLES